MAIEHIDPKVEKPFRAALGHALRGELSEMNHLLEELSVDQGGAALGLCILVTGYVAIDVCGRRWPGNASVRSIAEHVANTGRIVKEIGLKTQQVYDFISRVALGGEPLEDVFPDADEGAKLPFIVAAHTLGTYHPREIEWWEFLDAIEYALEKAWATDLNVLPALMLRARMPARPITADASQ